MVDAYDGASNTQEKRASVATRLRNEQSVAVPVTVCLRTRDQ